MRKAFAVVFGLLTFAVAAQAQVPSGNIFFGYSFYNTNLSNIDRANTNGWEATLEGKMLPWVGIIADFDGHYGSQNFPAICVDVVCKLNADVTEHNFLFGPRVSVPVGRLRPFGEAMIGAGHVHVNGFSSDTSFATALGGGVDYKLIPAIAWRLQGDYVHTHFFSIAQNNVRLSTGIVVRF